MHAADIVLEARWVVPVTPRGAVLEHHAVAIRDGRIVAIAPIAETRHRFADAPRVTLTRHHALLPGLVNAHTHAAMSLLRGAGDDLPLQRWLQERIWPLERNLAGAEFVHDGTRLAAAEMLRGGVTCCNDMYFFPGEAALALRSLGMRAVVGILAFEFPTRYAADADEYLRKGLAARDALRDDALIHFTLAPHAPYSVRDAIFDRIAILAEELDLPIHLHVHETQEEITQSLAQHGCRPLARLDRLGLVGERLLAVHAVHCTDDELALLADRGAHVAHCPASNLKLASGIAPVTAMLGHGINVAIGTDGAASNNRLDMLGETRLAALLAKGAAADATALPAAQAIECATLAGARALGLGKRIGSIEPGKDADLIALDLSAPEYQPCYDVLSQIVYSAGRDAVTHAWVAGRAVLAERTLTVGHAAEDAVLAAAPWQNQALQWLRQQ